MTVDELIKKYAEWVGCEDCSLQKQCPVAYKGVSGCVDYLERILEVKE